ncbi:hypothetical protein SAMN04488581_2598 [Mycolicibacterium neoaurum]|uniref:hypothetical protein n=1 Tax=Mycolicibacterium neoaurum TaxID=1795 RepID=UPI00055E3278|nr:hypothetical protein [Mycolicibacterium neoaurum]SDD58518.1 hypothetical protein SAMN04488581_2598 [Mycolicibacterium neoaurum]
MTSFGPDFSRLYPGLSTTPNPGIHNQDGPSGTAIGGQLPTSPGQIEKAGQTITGGVLHNVAVALGNVVSAVGDVFENAFQALSDWAFGIDEVLTEHTAAIANLEEVAAAGRTTAAYVGDLSDMVTAPRTLMVGYGAASGGGAGTHTHPIICPAVKPGYANGIGAPSTGDIWFTPVVADRTSYVTKLRWVGGADPSIFGMQWYEIALMIYNPTTGDLEKVWTSGNIKDTTAAASTLQELEVDMTGTAPGVDGTGPISQQCTPGQILFIAMQQTAPGFGQSARSVGYVPQAGIGRPSSLVLDAALYLAPGYSQGIPSSIDFSSLSKNNTMIPWGAVATSVDAP